jgi:hypothetical protein
MLTQPNALEKYRRLCIGQYGLSDEFYRNLWLNISDADLAIDISRVFSSKIRLIIFDLTIFENYTETLLDSNCCLHWQIPLATDWKVAVTKRFDDPSTQTIQIQHPKKYLIERPYNGLHTQVDQNELQLQMMFYIQLIENFKIKKYFTYSEQTANNFIQLVKDIFTVEIQGNVIIDKLYNLAVSNFNQVPQHSAAILNVLDMYYE